MEVPDLTDVENELRRAASAPTLVNKFAQRSHVESPADLQHTVSETTPRTFSQAFRPLRDTPAFAVARETAPDISVVTGGPQYDGWEFVSI